MQSSPNSRGDEKFNQSQMQGKVLINIHITGSQTPCSSVWQDCVLNDVIKSDIHERTMHSIPPQHYMLHNLLVLLKIIRKSSYLHEDFKKGRNISVWRQINSLLHTELNAAFIVSVFKIKQNVPEELSETLLKIKENF